MGETAQEVTSETALFSFEERRNIVLSFTQAYLRGAVRVRYWSPDSVGRVIDMRSGLPTSSAEVASTKATFHTVLQTACGLGTPEPEPQQITEAIDRTFEMLVMLRAGEFLEGQFLATPAEKARLDALEERVSSIEKLFEELQNRLKVQRPP